MGSEARRGGETGTKKRACKRDARGDAVASSTMAHKKLCFEIAKIVHFGKRKATRMLLEKRLMKQLKACTEICVTHTSR